MRARLIAAASAGLLVLTASGLRLAAQPTPVPAPNLNDRLTFQVLATPGYFGSLFAGANSNPLMNEGTSAALRRDIVAGLERRGYVMAKGDAGILVEYYLVLPRPTDVTDWDNGYLWRPEWARGEVPGSVNLSSREFADGAVVIDLVDPATGDLLWQGHRVADLPNDERRLTRDLRSTVRSILASVPEPAAALN